MKPLSFPMTLALRRAAAMDPHEWWLMRPHFHKSSIYALERRGLAEVDHYMGHFRLTDAGRSSAAELKGEQG